eukprot:899068-Pelagomonas_calceolata.AAC.2
MSGQHPGLQRLLLIVWTRVGESMHKQSVGLDLSFVNYVFLMEPLANKATEQQVIARAHRMGARRAVHVELLLMAGTAEEELCAMMASCTGSEREAAAVAAAEARAGAAGGGQGHHGAAGQEGGAGVAGADSKGQQQQRQQQGAEDGCSAAGAIPGRDGAQQHEGAGEGGAKGQPGTRKVSDVAKQRGNKRRSSAKQSLQEDASNGADGGMVDEGARGSGGAGSGEASGHGNRVALEKRGVRNLFFLHLRKEQRGENRCSTRGKRGLIAPAGTCGKLRNKN